MPNAKPVLIFVPGIGATGESYEPFLKRWRKQYDIRIAMHSRKLPARLDLPFFFRAIDEAAGSEQFILMGHSMGGLIALAYAARHPATVRKVIAIAPVVTARRRYGWVGLARHHWYRVLQNFSLAFRGGHPGHALKVVKIRSEVLEGSRRKKLYDWIGTADIGSDLPSLRNAIVLWARHEEVLYGDHLIELRKHPRIRIILVPGSHNYLPLHPRPLQRYIRQALDE